MMAFEELYLVSTRVAPLDGAAVDALLAECEIDPPGGYREFATRFGLGEVCGFLSLLAPDDVRRWRRDVGAFMLDEGLFELAAEQWTRCGVKFEQFRRGVDLWSTNQRPSYLAVPGHGPRVFEWDVGEVVCHERGIIDVIPAVARLMFNMSFPYFEPRGPSRRWDVYDPSPGLEVESFVGAVFERWGDGVRRLRSDEEDYVVTVFARPIQARFACWREEERHPGRLTHLGVSYEDEEEGELHDFLRPFIDETAGECRTSRCT
jgi:hypothetical protein